MENENNYVSSKHNLKKLDLSWNYFEINNNLLNCCLNFELSIYKLQYHGDKVRNKLECYPSNSR